MIDAMTPASHAFQAMKEILAAAEEGRIAVAVSLHSIHELEKGSETHPDDALKLV
ncbi:MAG: hypothetical protein ABIS15_00565 [Gemmatimonadaceae bacterium]